MYLVEFMPKAIKDMERLPKTDTRRIASKIRRLEQGLVGDIKKLTDFTPEYRMRIGNYRVLFEIDGNKITIYRVKHRNKAYSMR